MLLLPLGLHIVMPSWLHVAVGASACCSLVKNAGVRFNYITHLTNLDQNMLPIYWYLE